MIEFVIEYNNSLPNIGEIVNKYWDLFKLSKSDAVRALHEYRPVVAFKRPKNVKDLLVNTQFHKSCEQHISRKCNRSRCTHCCNIVESDSFSSSQYNTQFKLGFDTKCNSSDVIYLITCKKCKMQYVGQTSQQVGKRMNSHRYDINNYVDPAFSTYVATHFNEQTHSLQDFSFMPIDVIHNSMDRLMKETYWIHKLGTVYPNGMNSKVLYDVE